MVDEKPENDGVMAGMRQGDSQPPALSAWRRKKSSGCNQRGFAGGKGLALDNVFVERLWRTVEYEHVYLNPAESGTQIKAGLKEYFAWYNECRPHSSLNDRRQPACFSRRASSAIKPML